MPAAQVLEQLNDYARASRWSVARRGIGPELAASGLRPVIFASAAAHNSVAKACNLLGYGEDALRLVPVNARFQMDLDALSAALAAMAPEECVAAVVGIVGATAEGAVDPIHRIQALRERRERCPAGPTPAPFTFLSITEPETNLVCYVARPMRWEGTTMVPAPIPLSAINALNQQVYAAASVPGSRSYQPSAAQAFFISRTKFEQVQYRAEPLRPLLERLGVSEESYRKEGLFVLQSTVMNPWHGEAEQVGMDYLYEFLRFLHRVTAEALYGVPL